MKEEKVFLKGINETTIKQGEPGEIIGVVYSKIVEGAELKLSYKVQYSDYSVHYIAVDNPLYKTTRFKCLIKS